MKNFFALAIANSLLEVDSWKGGGGMGGIGGKGTHVDYSHGYTSGMSLGLVTGLKTILKKTFDSQRSTQTTLIAMLYLL